MPTDLDELYSRWYQCLTQTKREVKLPELPEVESLVRGVRKHLIGRSFTSVKFLRPDIREPIPVKRIKEILVGQKISDVSRRGKYMLIRTARGFLGVHLGMSGRFVESSPNTEMANHTHALFSLNDRVEYRFIDPRRFGRLFSVEKEELHSHPFLARLGREPLEDEHLALHLHEVSRKRSQAVKIFLMDSTIVVGIGNIYASEALWRAKIHPQTRANLLSLAQYESIADCVTNVLREAIAHGGTTLKDYRDKDGNPGYFQTNLAVYGKEAKPCQACGHMIAKVSQSGRSTFFCPFCQFTN